MSLEENSESLLKSQIRAICDEDETVVSEYDAFPKWVCENILNIDDRNKINNAVAIGGKNDYGVDIFHIDDESEDETDHYMCWAQIKYSRDLRHIVTREELESFSDTTGYLSDCPNKANSTFKDKSKMFRYYGGEDAPIRKKMVFVAAGRLNEQAQELIKSNIWKRKTQNHTQGPDIDLEIWDIDDILSFMGIRPTPKFQVSFDGRILERSDLTSNKKSIMGYVNAKHMSDIVKKHQTTLFLENPRQYLGKTITNKEIIKTLKEPSLRKKFWKLNNGITAVCDDFTELETDPAIYDVVNFKVVNGRQTTYTLTDFYKSLGDETIDNIFVSLTIHQTMNDEERGLISEATNTQNPIKPVDKITNNKELTNLVTQCKNQFPDFYFERQTRGFRDADKSIRNRVTIRRVLEKNHTARNYYAYMIHPNDALMADKDLFSSINPDEFNKVFQNRKIKELIIPHIFDYMLQALCKYWIDDINRRDKAILNKAIVKYYILNFIHTSMKTIEESKRNTIEDNLIKIFRELDKKDDTPQIFLDIAITAYDIFMTCFNSEPNITWPERFKKNSSESDYQEKDEPTDYEIMYALKKYGKKNHYKYLITKKEQWIKMTKSDMLKTKLLELESNSG